MARKPEYGRGAKAFLDYVQFIVHHPNYEGMPDLYTEDGGIQWEAPSNRGSGKYKDTHHRRRDWWRRKAVELGINVDASEWISQAAKALHPTKTKPCKTCGREMDLRYAYPNAHLLKRLRKLPFVGDDFPLDPLEHIVHLVERLVEQFGEEAIRSLPLLLATSSVSVPRNLTTLQEWLVWIADSYIPQEPILLSPGAMSNAPDRLDGFHSFNLCCRSTADSGRTKENLQSYTTDRRVFEYWVEGDWVAADRLMGLVRSSAPLKAVPCLNGHPGPCSADHIGPISLGFVHRPIFQFLCSACNSAKNNRMTYRDVEKLRVADRRGDKVTSWYCENLWNLRKEAVYNEETALRLSKLFRDNRHTAMDLFARLAAEGYFSFLCTFLDLDHSMFNVEFVNLRAEDHVTVFDRLAHIPRTTKYAIEQKARRVRVAFEALRDYVQKTNRNAFVISNSVIEGTIGEALELLRNSSAQVKALDRQLTSVINVLVPEEERLRAITAALPKRGLEFAEHKLAREILQGAMDLVGQELSYLWEDERYIRAPLEEF